MAELDLPVAIGQTIAGKYRVERLLGRGGMGVVLAATHLQLEHPVALKFMHPHLVRESTSVQRFLREARAACRLKGEHVARVMDVDQLPDGAPYIVIEYLEGQDLGRIIRKRGPRPLHQAIDYLLQVCEALSEAHALGIVHRDIKPQNLFLIRKANGQASVNGTRRWHRARGKLEGRVRQLEGILHRRQRLRAPRRRAPR